ncbi:MAG: Rod shape-determining protein MreD [candidate division TA06 bacterium 32_111]|uniref:Rod shape-determining protein MreD n=2 Tax=Bacteria candidate phyla TaxID=1783234 RepID=A0A101I468_UNCT6|nr:MAG: Rod shape-determining protein MreD [candidate division TA06 bacterium 32_111]KUK88109.1 MAG: Rod shape-determining protein MreD [candidate division TA06 bacterium 34_109]HAF07039.1 rod shape-determining protein MreD [candidate division WOR-3 bacterium]HCP16954.1 rod shape-determining protein MreD [candidate division WOR-3 bacterium]
MKYFLLTILSIIFIYFISTIPPFFSIDGVVQPDLIIILVIFVCFNFNEIFSYLFSFIIGFFCDAILGTYLGFHSSVYLIISYFTSRFGNLFYKEKFFNKLLLVLISDIFYRIILLVINFQKSKSIITIFVFVFIIPFYTVFLYFLFHYLKKFLKKFYVTR